MLTDLIKKTRWRFLATAGSSVLFGAMSVSLVALINEIINADAVARNAQFRWFALLAVAGVSLQLISKLVAEQLSEYSQAELRKMVANKTLNAKLSHLEQQGAAKIKSCLTEHSLQVAAFFMNLPTILTNLVIVLGAFVYMAWLDWRIFLFALLTLVLGSLGYSLANALGFRKISEAADLQDQVYQQFDAITDGAKELRLHRGKRHFFRQQVLTPAIDRLRQRRVEGASVFHMASSWGGFVIFAFIGGALFYLSAQTGEGQQKIMSGFALLFLYMLTPLEVLLGTIPEAAKAKASAATITELTSQLEAEADSGQPELTSFTHINLTAVSHRYYHEQTDDMFALKAINLMLLPGQLIYLVGGNGSGKTTFAKVLCGLYAAEAGQIKLDGELVTATKLDDYRQLFSSIFADYYLFDRLLENCSPALEAKGNLLISKLNLQHKVAIVKGAFTTRQLSQGQRKRLALVVAYLEDRPFYIFDEWAADQDPVFKQVFYHELLPELKAQQKTVLVITHDEQYFGLADRLLKMENGQLTELAWTEPVDSTINARYAVHASIRQAAD